MRNRRTPLHGPPGSPRGDACLPRRIRVFPLLLLACVLPVLLSGCALGAAAGQSGGSGRADDGTLVIGYKANGPLAAVKMLGAADRRLAALGVEASWRPYDDDASLARALLAGEADFGSVGDAAFAFAYAKEEGRPLYLWAVEPANPRAYAIIAKPESGIAGPADLQGRRVAYPPGSNEHYLLLAKLRQAGLSADDIAAAPMETKRLVRSFQEGEADAWAVSQPELSRLDPDEYRIVADGEGLAGNREIYVSAWGNDRKDALGALLEEIDVLSGWIETDIHKAAELLTTQTDLSHLEWLSVFDSKTYGSAPPLDGIVREQQELADALASLGARTESFDVRELLME
ncbi:ABC transporter substrate-binding protein [Paenibacillus thailandensis]|uniref:ABC transporter substrate-binding protein n=1 Tax=Paenibacillus thailandensis TaxID=393250 RepID=A0ABW5QVF6_9BACL